MRVHPDTYLPRLSAFTTYDGVTMPQSHEWDDAATPRTDAPVRFAWHFDAHNGGKVQAWTEPYSWEV